MTALILPLLALSLGFVSLSFSADRLISVSATYAKHCNVSLIFIGMTVVAFGTSAPELLVSFVAALNHSNELAIGNGIGSNIINIGVVLSICVLISPIRAHQRFVKREFPILAISIVLCTALMLKGNLGEIDGLILVLGLSTYCFYLAKSVQQYQVVNDEFEFLPLTKKRAGWESLVMLLLLLTSSRLMVWGAVKLAQAAGLSELTIGLTIVAFGTSLPELAAGIAGVRQKKYDIVFATVIGSNIFNLLGVIAFPALLGDNVSIPEQVLTRDLPFMALLTLMLGVMFALSYFRVGVSKEQTTDYHIHRIGGGVLLLTFCVYLIKVSADFL
ncbi:calcium/sodium antiporter [Thaumasiovibrio sp. DFM-14]|uniref:calcium/sodium antiporter n=1 Tax=Thaumasiovibrio sp. DFM-14 TaxID=3384792 RepID=UPI0039A11079